MGAVWRLRPPFLPPAITHQENHPEKTGKETQMGGSVQEHRLGIEPHISGPGPPTTAQARDLARTAPTPRPPRLRLRRCRPALPSATPTARAAQYQARDSRQAPPTSYFRPRPYPVRSPRGPCVGVASASGPAPAGLGPAR